ncbi:DEP domain-containing protein 1A [Halyomorpha halys]|uniref:DEP domain-containing protein 1A n=1 Tax=Halyomorpha halys TaxID=286706 RepID=UPI0006D50655|nr:DEP domain-containing protein 1B-like isoform X1 [Halyomorpha halys]
MTDCYSGPYRATALWNEAVLLFRDNMVLKEHRHRFHKHKNSFSGNEAVTLLLNALCSNPMFNPSISREQCCRLLRQFLKANLITPVKSCSLSNSKTTFYDSNKYLYEFTDQLVNFIPLQPVSVSNIKEVKTERCKSISETDKYTGSKFDRCLIWKLAIIKRIVELIKPFDIYKVTDFKGVNPSWVEINADPEFHKLKWNTELPDWILSAIHDLIKYTSKDYCGSTYPNFETDAFQVITDYFRTLDVPLIDNLNYNVYAGVFHHLEYLNCIESVKSPQKNIQSSRNLRDVAEVEQKKANMYLTDKVLPPNHCYEAAFTSDDPTIRVVPQCSVDSIHLKKNEHGIHKGIKMAYSENCLEKLKDTHVLAPYSSQENSYKRNTFKTSFVPLKPIDNVINKYSDTKQGIVNEGFLIFTPDKGRQAENFTTFVNKSDDFLNKKKQLRQDLKYKENENQCNNFIYVNHGLSFSLEDINLLAQNNLDYNYALESLNNLMKITQHNQSMSDDDHSFHTALSESQLELSDVESSDGNSESYHSQEIEWDPNVIELGSQIFQLLLIFLPPSSRAKLKYLCLLLYKISRNLAVPDLTLDNMLLKLEGCIVKAVNVDAHDFSTVNNILTFIVINYKTIFAELPADLLSNIKNELQEKELKKVSSCNQSVKDMSNITKNEESRDSLTQLLDHILQNKNISEKEKRKHLKLFKNCYPGIYRSRFPNENKHNKTKHLFSIKNLRL